jgi:hypothetical protein
VSVQTPGGDWQKQLVTPSLTKFVSQKHDGVLVVAEQQLLPGINADVAVVRALEADVAGAAMAITRAATAEPQPNTASMPIEGQGRRGLLVVVVGTQSVFMVVGHLPSAKHEARFDDFVRGVAAGVSQTEPVANIVDVPETTLKLAKAEDYTVDGQRVTARLPSGPKKLVGGTVSMTLRDDLAVYVAPPRFSSSVEHRRFLQQPEAMRQIVGPVDERNGCVRSALMQDQFLVVEVACYDQRAGTRAAAIGPTSAAGRLLGAAMQLAAHLGAPGGRSLASAVTIKAGRASVVLQPPAGMRMEQDTPSQKRWRGTDLAVAVTAGMLDSFAWNEQELGLAPQVQTLSSTTLVRLGNMQGVPTLQCVVTADDGYATIVVVGANPTATLQAMLPTVQLRVAPESARTQQIRATLPRGITFDSSSGALGKHSYRDRGSTSMYKTETYEVCGDAFRFRSETNGSINGSSYSDSSKDQGHYRILENDQGEVWFQSTDARNNHSLQLDVVDGNVAVNFKGDWRRVSNYDCPR